MRDFLCFGTCCKDRRSHENNKAFAGPYARQTQGEEQRLSGCFLSISGGTEAVDFPLFQGVPVQAANMNLAQIQ